MEFSKRLSQLRKQKHWSQGQLAEKVGTHPNLIGKYELGVSVPSVEMAGKLAVALETSLDYLVGTTDENIDNNLLDRFRALIKLPEEMKGTILRSLDNLLGKASAQLV